MSAEVARFRRELDEHEGDPVLAMALLGRMAADVRMEARPRALDRDGVLELCVELGEVARAYLALPRL